jgi:hypothetical protein
MSSNCSSARSFCSRVQRTVHRPWLQVYRPGRSSNIDPIPHPVLASNHGVYPASLLSLRPTFLRVSRDILRYS